MAKIKQRSLEEDFNNAINNYLSYEISCVLKNDTSPNEEKATLEEKHIYKDFQIDKIFAKIKVPSIKKNAGEFPVKKDKEHIIPLLTASTTNNGISRFAKKEDCDTILKNVLSVSANGNSGTVFYQRNDFAVLQDSFALKIIDRDISSVRQGLFLKTCLEKAIKENHDWHNKAGWEKIKTDKISLPVIKENKDENYEYTINDIDFNYMENFMKTIEEKAIEKLKKEGFC